MNSLPRSELIQTRRHVLERDCIRLGITLPLFERSTIGKPGSAHIIFKGPANNFADVLFEVRRRQIA